MIPPASFPALIGFVLWSIVVGILMCSRLGEPAGTPAVASPTAV